MPIGSDTHTLGVCSWSLRPTDPHDLARKVRSCGVRHVQLGLDAVRKGEWDERDTARALSSAGVSIASGMIGMQGEDYSTPETIKRTGGVRPDETWETNLSAARANAEIARRLGVRLVTFHAGFIPQTPGDPGRTAMLSRIAQIDDLFRDQGIAVALETGQESADTLLDALRAIGHANLGVNFDPANMVLYNTGDPIEALNKLAPHVRQVHIKDATYAKRPGAWGEEVRAGTGDVRWPDFFRIVKGTLPNVPVMIERESREPRIDDIIAARELVARHLPSP